MSEVIKCDLIESDYIELTPYPGSVTVDVTENNHSREIVMSYKKVRKLIKHLEKCLPVGGLKNV